ncbi:uncharacterized protein [Triticum aestivum]|uniref:uncharacterized protein isoform X8 n=1 Tax=Triticum aestivum TaxID=4565 RepID=UPI001D022276|nr:uncharacterized protein LOC123111182 isoform X8 [Triticum aestivum]
MRRSREALSRSVLLTIGSGPCHSRSSLDGRLFLFSVSGFLLCLSFRLAFTGLALVAQSILPTEVPPTCTKLLRQGGEEKGRGRCGGGWFTGPVALDWHQHRAPAYGNEDPFLGMRRSREALSRSVLLTIGSGPCHSRSSLDGRLFLFSVSGFLLCLSFRLAFTGLALVAQSILPTEVPPTCTKLLRQGGEEKGRGRCGGGWFTGPVALDWHQHRAPAYGNDDPFLGMRRSREALSRSVLLAIGSGPCHSRSSLDGRLFLFSVSGFLLCLSFRLAFTGLALVAQSILPTEVPPTCTKLLRQGGEEKGRGRCGGGWFTGPVALDWHQHRAPAYGNEDPFLGMRRSREALSRSVLLTIGSGPCHSRSSLDGRLFLFSVSGFLLCLSFRLAFTGLALVAQSILPTEVPPTCTKLLRQGGRRKEEGGAVVVGSPVRWHWIGTSTELLLTETTIRSWGCEDPGRHSPVQFSLLSVQGHATAGWLSRDWHWWRSQYYLQKCHQLAPSYCVKFYLISINKVGCTLTRGEEKGRGRCGGGWFTGPVALDWHQHRAPAYGNEDPFLGMRRSWEALSRSVLLTIGSGPCHRR